jgi:AhpD family alkylhydroperoxidase
MTTLSPMFARALVSSAAAVLLLRSPVLPARADEASDALAKTHQDIEKTFGKVPDFLKALPDSGLPGAWDELKAIDFDDGALTVKTKALIALAVAAQIPCQYCIWADTVEAKQAGATDAEIKEAVTVAALERHWSTVLNGMQVDLAQFKRDLAGDAAAGKQ